MKPVGPPQVATRFVIFDFDGTLAHLTIDFDHMRREVIALMDAYGLQDPALKRLHILEMIEEAALRVSTGSRLAEECGRTIEAIELEAATRAQLLPGTAEGLAALRGAGLKLGVITRNCRAAVLRADPDLLSRVDALVAREDARRVKPDPQHVWQCMAAMGAQGAGFLVGDHAMDMMTARASGLRGLGVLTGASTEAELRAAGAWEVYPDASAAMASILQSTKG